MKRRTFLGVCAGAMAAGLAMPARAGEYGGFQMGAQSYSFRHFDAAGAVAQLKKLGLRNMEFFGGHFATSADKDRLAEVQAMLDEAGVKVPAFGVEAFTDDKAANRAKFEFGKAMGLEVITADPHEGSFDQLDELTEEFGIKVAIHNHGPGARYDKVEDTLKAIEGHSKMIGACVDTGHVIRSKEKPHEVIKALGKRVHSLHLKDWKYGHEETIVGEGDMDVVAVAKTLTAIGFDGPVMLEYELQKENPVPGMKTGLENWAEAVVQVTV